MFGYCELDYALLKLLYTKFEIKSLFSSIILTSISRRNLLISLTAFFNETNSKAKLGHPILHVFVNREDVGMIFEFIDCWRTVEIEF